MFTTRNVVSGLAIARSDPGETSLDFPFLTILAIEESGRTWPPFVNTV